MQVSEVVEVYSGNQNRLHYTLQRFRLKYSNKAVNYPNRTVTSSTSLFKNGNFK